MMRKRAERGIIGFGRVGLVVGLLLLLGSAGLAETLRDYRKESNFWYDWTYNNYDVFGEFIRGYNCYNLIDRNMDKASDPLTGMNAGIYWDNTMWGEGPKSFSTTSLEMFTLKYKGLRNKLTLDKNIYSRTYFTPLCLDIPGFTGPARSKGIGWDVEKGKSAFTLLVLPQFSGGYQREATWLIGARGTTHIKTESLVDLHLGATFANLHDDYSKNPQSIMGPTPEKMESGIIGLRFSDDSPEDGVAGAAVKSIDTYVNDKYEKSLSIVATDPPAEDSGSSVSANGYREANGDAYFVYEFDLSGYADVKSVKFVITMANDYKVEQESGVPALRAKGNPQDYTNAGAYEYCYVLRGGINVFGFDFSGKVAGVELTGEIALNQKSDCFPGGDKPKGVSLPLATYIEGKRNILEKEKFSLGMRGEYFNINQDYDTSFFSNIDQREYNLVAPRDAQYIYWNSECNKFPTEGIPQAYLSKWIDRNNNGIPDWREDFILFFQSDEPLFMLGADRMRKDRRIVSAERYNGVIGRNNGILEDRNNNGIIDAIEMNNRPAYLFYEKGEQGVDLRLESSMFKELGLVLGTLQSSKPITGGKNNSIYALAKYRHELENIGPLIFQQEVKRVQDDIPDNEDAIPYVFQDKDDPATYTDPLYYKNSLVSASFVEFDYNRDYGKDFFRPSKEGGDVVDMMKGKEKILWVNRVRFIDNLQIKDAEIGQDKRSLIQAGYSTKFGYHFTFASEKLKALSLLPLAKYTQVYKVSQPALAGFDRKERVGAVMLRADYRLGRTSRVSVGLQYKKFWDDITKRNNYDKKTVLLQLGHEQHGFILNAGYKMDIIDSENPGLANTIHTWFVRVYVRG